MRSLAVLISIVVLAASAGAAIPSNDGVYRGATPGTPMPAQAADIAGVYRLTADYRHAKTVECLATATDPSLCGLMQLTCPIAESPNAPPVFPSYVGVFFPDHLELTVRALGVDTQYQGTVADGTLAVAQVSFVTQPTPEEVRLLQARLKADRDAGGPVVHANYIAAVNAFSACIKQRLAAH